MVDDSELGEAARAKLSVLAASAALNVARLDAPALACHVLPRVLPDAWLAAAAAGRAADWEADPAAASAGIDRCVY